MSQIFSTSLWTRSLFLMLTMVQTGEYYGPIALRYYLFMMKNYAYVKYWYVGTILILNLESFIFFNKWPGFMCMFVWIVGICFVMSETEVTWTWQHMLCSYYMLIYALTSLALTWMAVSQCLLSEKLLLDFFSP